jgi:MFS transporter, DHA1 family, tetracycline resistance protein
MATPTRRVAPLYAAGFVTAFGAHGIAATLGVYTHDRHASLLVLGALLAVYDGAEGHCCVGGSPRAGRLG